MELMEALEGKNRDYKTEKEVLLEFSKVLRTQFSLSEIKKVLEQNGFKGVYLLDEGLFSQIDNAKNANGLYNCTEKVIVMNSQSYNENKEIGVHEMGHAFLDNKNIKNITVNEYEHSYGKGLEEGAMALLMNTKNIEDISKANPYTYYYLSRIFQQLNALYGYSKLKEYPNLLVQLMKKPESFIPIIRDVYYDIFKQNINDIDDTLISRSAFYTIEGSDIILSEKIDINGIFKLIKAMNSIYFAVADDKVRTGKRKNDLFYDLPECKVRREELLLACIFDTNVDYIKRQQNNLDIIARTLFEKFEFFEEDSKSKETSKILLPR